MSDRGLWLAVIAQAIIDATQQIGMGKQAGKRKPFPPGLSAEKIDALRTMRQQARLAHIQEATAIQNQARAWLLRGGRDFARVCDYAGVDREYVRDKAVALAAAGWPADERRGARLNELAA